jgi:hypothetical protein
MNTEKHPILLSLCNKQKQQQQQQQQQQHQ